MQRSRSGWSGQRHDLGLTPASNGIEQGKSEYAGQRAVKNRKLCCHEEEGVPARVLSVSQSSGTHSHNADARLAEKVQSAVVGT
jgi:hypothetical protein